MPSNLSVDEIKYKAVRLSWLRGYHGGFAQTFVVQVSTDLKKWRNVSSIFDGKNENAKPVSTTLTNLQDSTTYFLRVYAYNDEGKSSYTDYVNFSTIAGGKLVNWLLKRLRQSFDFILRYILFSLKLTKQYKEK